MEPVIAWIDDHKPVAIAAGVGLVAFLAFAWIRNRKTSATSTAAQSGQLYLPQLYTDSGGGGGSGVGGLAPPPATTLGGDNAATSGALTGSPSSSTTGVSSIQQTAAQTLPVVSAPTLVLANDTPSTAVIPTPVPVMQAPASMPNPPAAPDQLGIVATPPFAYAQWQQDLGLSPASGPPAGLAPGQSFGTATPIIVQGSVVGESFSGGNAPLTYSTDPSAAAPPRQSIYGPVTQAQYDLLPATARL